MNLAGHPFALLQSPKRQNETSIFYDWQRTVGGREVTASWRVETPAVFGLPGPEEELLYLVLLQLTREAAEAAGTPDQWPTVVKFSRGELLRRLGWSDSAEKYSVLSLAFARLKSVSIIAKHAFHDARLGRPADEVGFGILDNFSLVSEPKGRKNQAQLPLSHFEWNTILHTSFLSGNVRSLALDFAIALQYPTSRRLFRLLELLRYASKPPRPQISIGMFKLRDRLGMTDYKYPSKIAEKLAPAVAELIASGYLHGMSVEKDKSGAAMAVFRFFVSETPKLPGAAPEAPQSPLAAPQTALPLSLPGLENWGALLPSFDTPASDELDDPKNAMVDAFFEALAPDEKAEIDARVRTGVRTGMPQFLQENPRVRGALLALGRGRRRETLARYPHALAQTS